MTSRPAAITRTVKVILFTRVFFLAFIAIAAAIVSVIWLLTRGPAGVAARPSQVTGIWTGTLQTYYCPGINCRPTNLRLFLHVTTDTAGKLRASFDSIDQGAMDLPGDNVALRGNVFTFDIPSIKGNYQGTLSADGNSLNGIWSQGIILPLLFTRVTAPAGVAGIWEGDYGACPLRLVLRVKADSAGRLGGSLDSVDQGVIGLPIDNVVLKGNAFSFDIPPVGGNYQAKISADGYLKGAWSQGTTLPLVFTRTTAAAAPTPEPMTVRPPVALDNLKAVLDKDLKPVLEHGLLSKPTGGGLVIGVLYHGQRRIFAYGTAHPDSIFEIGSITKTFTGLILAQMVVQKQVSLNEPVRALLPIGCAGKPSAHEITLLDLATHHSGLPRDADNLKPKNPANPYADYDAQHLSEFLTRHGLAKPPQAKFLYSNLGFGLMGYALSQRAGVSYAQLVKTEITDPLHMHDTVVTMSPAQRERLIQGYDDSFNRAPAWDWDAVAGEGALKSTASDMLTYLDANLHPERYAAGAAPASPLATLPAAVALQHQSRADAQEGVKQAIAWGINLETHSFGHTGGTYGCESVAVFNPARDGAIIALYNRWIEDDPHLVDFLDLVVQNVSGLLGSGEPPPPLDFLCEADRRGLARLGIQ